MTWHIRICRSGIWCLHHARVTVTVVGLVPQYDGDGFCAGRDAANDDDGDDCQDFQVSHDVCHVTE